MCKGGASRPATCELLGRVLRAALAQTGLPLEAFSLLTGGEEVGAALLGHPMLCGLLLEHLPGADAALRQRLAGRASPLPLLALDQALHTLVVLPAALNARAEEIERQLWRQLLAPDAVVARPGALLCIDGDGYLDLRDVLVEAASGARQPAAARPCGAAAAPRRHRRSGARRRPAALRHAAPSNGRAGRRPAGAAGAPAAAVRRPAGGERLGRGHTGAGGSGGRLAIARLRPAPAGDRV